MLLLETDIRVVPNPKKPFKVNLKLSSTIPELEKFAREGLRRSERYLNIKIGNVFQLFTPYEMKTLYLTYSYYDPEKRLGDFYFPLSYLSEATFDVAFKCESHAEQFVVQINKLLQSLIKEYENGFKRVSSSKYYSREQFILET